MRLHLICNGMMAFWYRPAEEGRPDGYRILIPQSPMSSDDMKTQEHELRFGAAPGAPHSVLSYCPNPQPTQSFELRFAHEPSGKQRAMKPGASNLALYSAGERKVYPDCNRDKPAGVAFTIDIPYPACEEAARYETYLANPYMGTGCCVQDFCINPSSLPRCNVYTFHLSKHDSPVFLQNKHDSGDRRLLVEAPIHHDVKLYLYSGPAHCMPRMSNHLMAFNNMLLYQGQPLDLARDPDVKATCTRLEAICPPEGVTRHDLKNLAELNDKIDLCDCQEEHGREPRFTDPAECAIGNGC
jgi:hypothetical protein